MADELKRLRKGSFRNIFFPIQSREYGFAHDQARHKLIFEDGELVEALGSQNPTYSYRIPFREEIQKFPWVNLFTVVYPLFLRACKDRSRGRLVDPVHGFITARCVRLQESLDSSKKDGVDVVAEFVDAPTLEELLPKDGEQGTVEGAKRAAGIFDAEVKKVDWKQEPSPEPMLDPFDAITSIGDQLELIGNKVTANMHNVAFKAEKARRSIDKVKNPNLAPLRTAASRLQLSAQRLNQTLTTPPRPTRVLRQAVDIGRLALAAQYGMTVQDLLRLNPSMANSPTVRAGTQIRIFRG